MSFPLSLIVILFSIREGDMKGDAIFVFKLPNAFGNLHSFLFLRGH